MMPVRLIIVLLVVCFASVCFSQWSSLLLPGQGGEPNLATDGRGNVYLTTHMDGQIFKSSNFGQSYTLKNSFSSTSFDFNVVAKRDGNVIVTYISELLDGIKNWYSTDFANTFNVGSGPTGPLDREWMAVDPSSNNIFLIYSRGYIGGPSSTGVYLSKSIDGGQTFSEVSRVDDDNAPTVEPVDPYLATSSNGRVYAMWATSTDANSIDNFKFAYSTDGGITFTGHKVLATINKTLGNAQERWILGSIVSNGANFVAAIYANYEQIEVDNVTYFPLLVHYTYSQDGGQTFSTPKTVSSPVEIADAIRSFEANKIANINYPFYLQTLPWAATDPLGFVHVAYADNRDGQALIQGQPNGLWQIRYARGTTTFSNSERLSASFKMRRPALDFLSIAADTKQVYASWIVKPNSILDLNFFGDIFVARKPNILFAPIVYRIN